MDGRDVGNTVGGFLGGLLGALDAMVRVIGCLLLGLGVTIIVAVVFFCLWYWT